MHHPAILYDTRYWSFPQNLLRDCFASLTRTLRWPFLVPVRSEGDEQSSSPQSRPMPLPNSGILCTMGDSFSAVPPVILGEAIFATPPSWRQLSFPGLSPRIKTESLYPTKGYTRRRIRGQKSVCRPLIMRFQELCQKSYSRLQPPS